MARPRAGEWLADELRGLSLAGVDVLVSLLSQAEIDELGLQEERDLAAAEGLDFYWLPTPDRQVPEPVAVLELADLLLARLRTGDQVAVHCRHGIGRASTLAAAVLVREGVPAAAAWESITAARGLPVPDTPSQREFIDSLPPVSG